LIGWEYGFYIGLLKLAAKMGVGLGMLFGGITVFNKLNGVQFTDVLEELRKDPRALATYYGDRLKAMGFVILGVLIGSLT
jgi:hypothetical protein